MNTKPCAEKKIGNLLISTDGSEFSEGAIREGIKLSKSFSAKATALSVIEYNPEFEALAPDLVEKHETGALSHVQSVKERAEKEAVACETLIKRSVNPYAQIVEEASGLNPDMIVMGRRGRTGLMRLLMGSVTARVVGHSPVNVLVVPRAAKPELKNILVATDGSKYSEAAAYEAVCLAKSAGGSITAISVADTDMKEAEENVAKVKQAAEAEGVKVEALAEKGSPYEVIVNKARAKNADLIVMGSHGRSGIRKLLMGSVTERVIGHTEGAVLVVRLKE
jgi:nucleotide-binding universal stress UspA family protein